MWSWECRAGNSGLGCRAGMQSWLYSQSLQGTLGSFSVPLLCTALFSLEIHWHIPAISGVESSHLCGSARPLPGLTSSLCRHLQCPQAGRVLGTWLGSHCPVCPLPNLKILIIHFFSSMTLCFFLGTTDPTLVKLGGYRQSPEGAGTKGLA